MRAGRLHERVTLQQPVTTQDDYGQDIITWADVATVWAGVEPLRGRDFHEAQQHTNELTTRIVMRKQPFEVLPTWRVVHGSAAYEVHVVIDPASRNATLELMCSVLL